MRDKISGELSLEREKDFRRVNFFLFTSLVHVTSHFTTSERLSLAFKTQRWQFPPLVVNAVKLLLIATCAIRGRGILLSRYSSSSDLR